MDDGTWNALIGDAERFRYSDGQSEALRLGESLSLAEFEALFGDASFASAE